MMAYLVGLDGGKEAAINMVTAAAAYPKQHQAEAQFALVLLLNREREYARAACPHPVEADLPTKQAGLARDSVNLAPQCATGDG